MLHTAYDVKTMMRMASATKRDSYSTSACEAGSLQLELDNEFQVQQAQRVCYDPQPVPKANHEYMIRCSSSSAWASACKKAGGDVCQIKASVFGKYGGDSNEDATYKWETDMCVPVACKKGDNIKQYINYFENVLCPIAEFTQCSMSLTCGGASAKSIVIVASILGALAVISLIGIAGYFTYTRYYITRTPTPASGEAATFSEYSELAQYEEDEFINDTSGTQLDGEEEHPIN
jgi:hypothetical protein